MYEALKLDGMTPGERARILRLALHLRQVDVASMASTFPREVTMFEKAHPWSNPKVAARILEVLSVAAEERGLIVHERQLELATPGGRTD